MIGGVAAIAGIGATEFSKDSGRSELRLAAEAVQTALADAGLPADFLRVRGFPFVAEVRAFVEEHEHCFVVEQNRDAQLRSLITIETGVGIETMHPVLAYGGFPLSAQQVVDSVLAKLEN